MMNLESLCLVMAAFLLLVAVIGLVVFGIDLWIHFHSANTGAARIALDYEPLGRAVFALFAFGTFFGAELLLRRLEGKQAA